MSTDEEKTYACSICLNQLPKSSYSGKQLKAKGKRKCKQCAGQAHIANTEASKVTVLLDKKANDTVKHADWAELQKSQRDKTLKLVSPENDKYDMLIAWLVQHGAKFPHLQLKYYTQDYRGVHAKRRLAQNEKILTVPLECVMTTEKAKASNIGQAIIRAGEDCLRSSHSWLAALLLEERANKESYWKPYIDTLPQHYRNMPVFFDEEELAELEGSFSLGMINNRKISLKYEYDEICKSVPEFRRYHHLDFVWARLAVITRIFGFEVMGKKTDGLVPMADMLNHKRPNETTWTYNDNDRGFIITTTKTLLKGAQIFDSYGRKCNSRYFVNYGFSLDQNEDNQVAFHFQIPPESKDSMYHIKARLLGDRKTTWQIPFDHCESVTNKAFSWLRICVANEDEIKTIMETCDNNFKNVGPLNPHNEARVLQAIAAQAMKTLRGFPTTLDEDNKLLSDPNNKLTMNIRNCIIMRRGEKEVCHAYVNLSPIATKWADMDYTNFRRSFNAEIKGKGSEPSIPWRREKYVKEIWFPFWTGEKIKVDVTSNAHEGD